MPNHSQIWHIVYSVKGNVPNFSSDSLFTFLWAIYKINTLLSGRLQPQGDSNNRLDQYLYALDPSQVVRSHNSCSSCSVMLRVFFWQGCGHTSSEAGRSGDHILTSSPLILSAPPRPRALLDRIFRNISGLLKSQISCAPAPVQRLANSWRPTLWKRRQHPLFFPLYRRDLTRHTWIHNIHHPVTSCRASRTVLGWWAWISDGKHMHDRANNRSTKTAWGWGG